MLIRNCLGGIYVATGLVPGDEALAAAGHEPKQPQACHHEPSVGGVGTALTDTNNKPPLLFQP